MSAENVGEAAEHADDLMLGEPVEIVAGDEGHEDEDDHHDSQMVTQNITDDDDDDDNTQGIIECDDDAGDTENDEHDEQDEDEIEIENDDEDEDEDEDDDDDDEEGSDMEGDEDETLDENMPNELTPYDDMYDELEAMLGQDVMMTSGRLPSSSLFDPLPPLPAPIDLSGIRFSKCRCCCIARRMFCDVTAALTTLQRRGGRKCTFGHLILQAMFL